MDAPLLTEVRVTRCEQLPDAARHLAWRRSVGVAGCDDGSVMGVEADTALQRIGHVGDAVTALAAGIDHLAVGTQAGTGVVLSPRGVAARAHGAAPIRAAAFIGPTVTFAAGSELIVIDGDRRSTLSPDLGFLTAIATLERTRAIAGGVHGLAWFDSTTMACETRLQVPTIVALSGHPGCPLVAAGDLAGTVHVLRADSDEHTKLDGYPDRVQLLGWLPPGPSLCATADDEVTVWTSTALDSDDGEPQRLLGHKHPVTALSSSPTEGLLATGDAGGGVCVWAPLDVDAPVAHVRADGAVLAIAWSETGRELLVSTSTGQLLRCAVTRGSIV